MNDLRVALRTLRQSPVFTLVAILSLALGAGANTAIFSLVDAVMLKMLPVDHPEQLQFVSTVPVESGGFRISRMLTFRALGDIRERSKTTIGVASAYEQQKLLVGVDGQTLPASGHFISTDYFSTLGIHPFLGRAIGSPDDNANARVAVMGYGYWQRRFGADPRAVGRAITVNSVPFTIVGVAPREFYGLSLDSPAELLFPYTTVAQVEAGHPSADLPKIDNSCGTLAVRLAPGATPKSAEAELSQIFRQSEIEKAGENPSAQQLESIDKAAAALAPAAQGISVVRLQVSDALKILVAVVGLVMLIACANVANLLMAKASGRSREIAIRLSLGSTRWRLARQLLTESLLLSAAGGLLGLLFALWAGDAILHAANVTSVSPDWNLRVFAFTAGIVVLSALLFGAAPAFRSTSIDFAAALKSSRSSQDTGRSRFARALVAAQIALSLALVISAGLFIRTFRSLNQVDLGYARDHVLMAALEPSLAGYKGPRLAQIWNDALARASAIPGVRSASLVGDRFMAGFLTIYAVSVPGYTVRPGEDPNALLVTTNSVGPHFVSTTGIGLISGRDFDDRDASRNVAIVNESFARHFLAGQNPIGHTITLLEGKPPFEIVGLVADIKYISVQDQDNEIIFLPLSPESPPARANLILRTKVDPASLASALRDAIHSVDPNLPLFEVATMDAQVSKSLSQPRLIAILSGFFGALALTLATIGLYGVLAFSVSRRTSEIGIRMALGAEQRRVLRMILSETARVTLAGIIARLAIAFAAARLIKSLLFGVTPYDTTSIVIAVVVLTAAALLAGLIPARRASQVDPMIALRHE